MRKVGIAILGLGVVGGGTYKILAEHRELYKATQNVDLAVESVLECNAARIEELKVPKEMVAANIAEIVANPDVSIVVETIGGVKAAKEYVLAALNAGKTVVTSNKELVSKYADELERTAKRQNAGFLFEACCGGGIPIVRTLLDGVQANEIRSLVGIVNGTTNYILTRMNEGKSYEEALCEAQEQGFAEADPTADVDGSDAAFKLSILSTVAFHKSVPIEKIHREGILSLTKEDFSDASSLGYCIKLLAVGKNTEAGIEAHVYPALVKRSHPLASVNGSYNAVLVTGDSVGDVMLYGKGAGSLPTASSVVSDVIYAATHTLLRYPLCKKAEKERFLCDGSSAYFLRLIASDRPGVLAKISSIFGKDGISLAEILQRGTVDGKAVGLVVTHETHENAVKSAVERIQATGIATVESVLRILA